MEGGGGGEVAAGSLVTRRRQALNSLHALRAVCCAVLRMLQDENVDAAEVDGDDVELAASLGGGNGSGSDGEDEGDDDGGEAASDALGPKAQVGGGCPTAILYPA